MPTGPRREDELIERFVLGYEERTWVDSTIDWPDKTADNKVDALVSRQTDGKTLAIEHTIIEPFTGEKQDFAEFERVLVELEADTSLVVPERWIRVFIQVGALRNKSQRVRRAVADSVREWIRKNRNLLPTGESSHRCSSNSAFKESDFEVMISTKVVPLPGPGKLHVRRQQMVDDFSDVVAKALRSKLPKLVATVADRRILLLERQHMNLLPSRMLAEIETLAAVNEIWIVETMAWDSERCVFFEYYKGGIAFDQFGFAGHEFFG